MRFFEFAGDPDDGIDKFIMILRNYVGRAASKKAPVTLNWNGLSQVTKSNGFEFAADYETFKSMFDNTPALQSLVKDFNADGISLKVPGAPDDQEQSPQQAGQTSQDQVDQTADTAAAGQLAASQTMPKV
jgi:hypothetical protein